MMSDFKITREQRVKLEVELRDMIEKTNKALSEAEGLVSSASFQLTEFFKKMSKELDIEPPKTLTQYKVSHIINGTETITFRMSLNSAVNKERDKLHYIETVFRNLFELLCED